VVLALAGVFTVALGALTFYVLISSGPDVLVVTSLLVLGLLACGVIGALIAPPGE
jgi:hypothetical protein